MDINKKFTFDELKEAMNKLKPKKEVHVNQESYGVIVEKIGYAPQSIVINNFIPPNQAIIIDNEQVDMMREGGLRKLF